MFFISSFTSYHSTSTNLVTCLLATTTTTTTTNATTTTTTTITITTITHKDDADWVEWRMLMETEGTRQRGCRKKIWWNQCRINHGTGGAPVLRQGLWAWRPHNFYPLKYTKNEDNSHTHWDFYLKNSLNFLKFWKYSFTYFKFLYFFDNLCNSLPVFVVLYYRILRWKSIFWNLKIWRGASFFSVCQGLQNFNPALDETVSERIWRVLACQIRMISLLRIGINGDCKSRR